MSPLPRALVRWQTQLEALPDGTVEAIGPMLGRLDALVGPMRHRPMRGGGEPDGLSGLARRGPWERLLVTEWALADVAPEEFLRRVTQGEQLFRELARRTPQAGRSCRVLLDAGPDQLGAPRLVQIALLVVLAVRAEVAGASFWWGSLQGTGCREGWADGSVQAHIAARSIDDPTPEDLERHVEADPGPEVEWWVLGGSRAAALGDGSLRTVTVEERLDPDAPGISVGLTVPGGARRTIHLDALAPTQLKQVFRRPVPTLEPPAPMPLRAELGPWRNGFRFSDQGTRLLGITRESWITAVKVQKARRFRRPKQRYMGRGALAAVGWHNQKPLWVTRDGAYQVHGTPQSARWDASAPAGEVPVGTVVHFVSEWGTAKEARRVCVMEGDGRVHVVPYDDPSGAHVLVGSGLALGRRSGVPLLVRVVGGRACIEMHPVRTNRFERVETLGYDAKRAWLGPPTHTVASGHRMGLIAIEVDPQVVMVVGLGRERDVFAVGPDEQVWGVTLVRGDDAVSARLVLQHADDTLWLASGIERSPIPGAVDVIEACSSPGHPRVAWMNRDREVFVYDVDAGEVVLSFQTGDGA